MTALPAASDFTGPARTEGQAKSAYDGQRAFLAGLLGADGTPATALATLGALGGAYLAKTAAYTVTTSDRGRVINATGPFTLSLPAAATAGAGFAVVLRALGGTVTVDPSGAELIDGASTLKVTAGRSVLIVCTGTAWVAALDTFAGLTTTDAYATVDPASTANAIVLTTGRGYAAIPTGLQLRFRATLTNTGAATAALDGLAPLAMRTVTGVALPAGYIRTDVDTRVTFDGTYLVVHREEETGANANGSYTRFASGLQICTNQAFTTDAAGAQPWTYPAAFVYPASPGRPAVSGAISTVSGATAVLGIGGISGSGGYSTSVIVWARQMSTDAFVSAAASLIATGRWY